MFKADQFTIVLDGSALLQHGVITYIGPLLALSLILQLESDLGSITIKTILLQIIILSAIPSILLFITMSKILEIIGAVLILLQVT